MDHALYIHMAERAKSKETLPNPQSQNPRVIPTWLKHQALGQLRVLSYVSVYDASVGVQRKHQEPFSPLQQTEGEGLLNAKHP